MIVTKDGILTKNQILNEQIKARPVFNKVKNINSIFLDNSIKTDKGYLFTPESMTTTIKLLTKYLKNNP